MAQAKVVLIVEDSEQDFQDVSAYVESAASFLELEKDQDYSIDHSTSQQATVESLDQHEKDADKLITIFDLHMEESNEDLTELIAAIIKAPSTSWRAAMPIIVFSQAADDLENRISEHHVSRHTLQEKRDAKLLYTVSKSLRAREDARERLREAILSALRIFSTDSTEAADSTESAE